MTELCSPKNCRCQCGHTAASAVHPSGQEAVGETGEAALRLLCGSSRSQSVSFNFPCACLLLLSIKATYVIPEQCWKSSSRPALFKNLKIFLCFLCCVPASLRSAAQPPALHAFLHTHRSATAHAALTVVHWILSITFTLVHSSPMFLHNRKEKNVFVSKWFLFKLQISRRLQIATFLWFTLLKGWSKIMQTRSWMMGAIYKQNTLNPPWLSITSTWKQGDCLSCPHCFSPVIIFTVQHWVGFTFS